MKKPTQKQIQWAANEFAKNELGDKYEKNSPVAIAIKYYFTAGANLVLQLLKPLTKI